MTQRRRRSRTRYDVFDDGFQLDSDLTVVDHLGGSRKVDIYLCQSESLDRHVACKVLRSEYLLDFSALEAVLGEGQMICELDHPNVIKGYRVELEPYPRIVMRYLQGQTLKDTFFTGNYKAFGVGDAVDVVDQLADGLTYLHKEGLVHLDVKPSNIMYHDGDVTLLDLSVAEEFSPDHPLRDNAGTTEYMAPEQTYRCQIGYATDVFGLAVVFYQLLASEKLPYPVVTRPLPDAEEATRQLNYDKPPRPPSEINPDVPPSIDEVVLKALHVDIDQRYQSPDEFQKALMDADDLS